MRLCTGPRAAARHRPRRCPKYPRDRGPEYPRDRGRYRTAGTGMKSVHMVLGIIAIALTGGAALLGAWCWWRVRSTAWFWRLLRASQVVVIVQVLWGGLLLLTGHKAPSLHYIYGVLPLLV